MKVLVSYVAFHPNNYQGGEGDSFSFTKLVEVPDDIHAKEVYGYIENWIQEEAYRNAPYKQDFKATIKSIQFLF